MVFFTSPQYSSPDNQSSISLELTGTLLDGFFLLPPAITGGGPGVANCSIGNTLCIDATVSAFDAAGNARCQDSANPCFLNITETATYIDPLVILKGFDIDTSIEQLSISTVGGLIYRNDDTFTGVPEPTSLILMAGSLVGFGLVRLIQRSKGENCALIVTKTPPPAES